MPDAKWRPDLFSAFPVFVVVCLIGLALGLSPNINDARAQSQTQNQTKAAAPHQNAPAGVNKLAAPYFLKPQDKVNVRRAEKYLNTITTLQSRFLQVTSLGQFSEGMLYMSRPGKMRVEYDAPTPILIVANNGTLTYVDLDFDQPNYYPLDETPAGLLLRGAIKLLSDEFVITAVVRETGTLRITLSRANDPLLGLVTLIFSESPFQLKKWEVVDAQGLLTAVALQGPRFGAKLADQLFVYQAPEDAGN